MRLLRYVAITGNILFSLWILYNGIDDGLKATPVQMSVYIALWMLFALNSYIIMRSR